MNKQNVIKPLYYIINDNVDLYTEIPIKIGNTNFPIDSVNIMVTTKKWYFIYYLLHYNHIYNDNLTSTIMCVIKYIKTAIEYRQTLHLGPSLDNIQYILSLLDFMQTIKTWDV